MTWFSGPTRADQSQVAKDAELVTNDKCQVSMAKFINKNDTTFQLVGNGIRYAMGTFQVYCLAWYIDIEALKKLMQDPQAKKAFQVAKRDKALCAWMVEVDIPMRFQVIALRSFEGSKIIDAMYEQLPPIIGEENKKEIACLKNMVPQHIEPYQVLDYYFPTKDSLISRFKGKNLTEVQKDKQILVKGMKSCYLTNPNELVDGFRQNLEQELKKLKI